jgi:hypothetical protein
MLIIIRQIKSMPKHFCAKEELCRKTVMPNDIMSKIFMQLKGIPLCACHFARYMRSSSSSSAIRRPLLSIDLRQGFPRRLVLDLPQPAASRDPHQIVGPLRSRSAHGPSSGTWSPLQNLMHYWLRSTILSR